MAESNPDDNRMSLGDHLGELQKRLFLGLIGPVIAAIAMIFVADWIISILTIPLLKELQATGQPVNLFANQVGATFGLFLRVCVFGGLIIGIPWLGYQLWLFIAPALFSHEKRFAIYLVPGSALLAITGVLFMYFVALPFTLYFLIGFGTSFAPPIIPGPTNIDIVATPGAQPLQLPIFEKDPENPPYGSIWINKKMNQVRWNSGIHIQQFRFGSLSLVTQQQDLGEYFSFVTFLALAFAIAFQLPLVMLALGWAGIMNYEVMRKGWKFVIMGCIVVGAILTPADLASMVALAVPLYVLYEFGLQLVKYLTPKKAAESDGDADEDTDSGDKSDKDTSE